MSSFINLVTYEYKKIWKRKSTYISFLLIIIGFLLSSGGYFFGSSYEYGEKKSKHEVMVTERTYARKLEGAIDEQLINLIIQQNQLALSDPSNLVMVDGYFTFTNEAYEEFVRPYKQFYFMLNEVYPIQDIFRLDKLALEDANLFYENRNAKLLQQLDVQRLTKHEIDKHMQLNNKITTPFHYDYAMGYFNYMLQIGVIGVFTSLAISISIASIFSGEYTSKVDQLILTTRYGKNKVIIAKLFTGLTYSFLVTLSMAIISLLVFLGWYGFSGADANIQTMDILSTYPVTMLGGTILMILIVICACLLISTITLLCSARLKTPFSTIIITNLLIFVPLFIPGSTNNRVLQVLIKFLPAKMMEYSNVFSDQMFLVLGNAIEPYIFMPVFCVIVILVLLPFCYRGFKNHQIT